MTDNFYRPYTSGFKEISKLRELINKVSHSVVVQMA